GCVLEERERSPAHFGIAPALGPVVVDRVGSQQLETRQDLLAAQQIASRADLLIEDEGETGLRVARDAADSRQAAPGLRKRERRERHGDRSGVKTAEKGDQKIETLRQGQKDPFTGGAAIRQHRADRSRPAVQLGVGDRTRPLLAVLKENKSLGFGHCLRPAAKKLDEAVCLVTREKALHSVASPACGAWRGK